MSHGHFIRAFKEFGVAGTFKKLYKMRTLKFGAYMGTDELGNKYYENKIDYPHGALLVPYKCALLSCCCACGCQQRGTLFLLLCVRFPPLIFACRPASLG